MADINDLKSDYHPKYSFIPLPKTTAKPLYQWSNFFKKPNEIKLNLDSLNFEKNRFDIVLDAGHGGSVPGAIGIYKGKTVRECDVNRPITEKVAEKLKKDGYKVKVLLNKDETVNPQDRRDAKEKINPRIFASIHTNCFPKGKGIELIFGNNNTEVLQKNLTEAYKDKGFFMRWVHQDTAMWVLKGKVPSVIIETGFINNKKELKKLLSEKGQDEQAQIISGALEKTLTQMKKKNKKSQSNP